MNDEDKQKARDKLGRYETGSAIRVFNSGLESIRAYGKSNLWNSEYASEPDTAGQNSVLVSRLGDDSRIVSGDTSGTANSKRINQSLSSVRKMRLKFLKLRKSNSND